MTGVGSSLSASSSNGMFGIVGSHPVYDRIARIKRLIFEHARSDIGMMNEADMLLEKVEEELERLFGVGNAKEGLGEVAVPSQAEAPKVISAERVGTVESSPSVEGDQQRRTTNRTPGNGTQQKPAPEASFRPEGAGSPGSTCSPSSTKVYRDVTDKVLPTTEKDTVRAVPPPKNTSLAADDPSGKQSAIDDQGLAVAKAEDPATIPGKNADHPPVRVENAAATVEPAAKSGGDQGNQSVVPEQRTDKIVSGNLPPPPTRPKEWMTGSVCGSRRDRVAAVAVTGGVAGYESLETFMRGIDNRLPLILDTSRNPYWDAAKDALRQAIQSNAAAGFASAIGYDYSQHMRFMQDLLQKVQKLVQSSFSTAKVPTYLLAEIQKGMQALGMSVSFETIKQAQQYSIALRDVLEKLK